MAGTIVIEVLILWVCYALYMAVLVHRRGPIGGVSKPPELYGVDILSCPIMSLQGILDVKKPFCAFATWTRRI